jgi:hypothetical protein
MVYPPQGSPAQTLAGVYALSDTVIQANDAQVSTTSISYVKVKEIKIASVVTGNVGCQGSGTSFALRIKFDLKTSNTAGLAKGQVYRNGVAVGTERSTNSTSYVTFSEDITQPWTQNDLIQLYIKTNDSAYTTYAQNFRVCGTYVSNPIQSSTFPASYTNTL